MTQKHGEGGAKLASAKETFTITFQDIGEGPVPSPVQVSFGELVPNIPRVKTKLSRTGCYGFYTIINEELVFYYVANDRNSRNPQGTPMIASKTYDLHEDITLTPAYGTISGEPRNIMLNPNGGVLPQDSKINDKNQIEVYWNTKLSSMPAPTRAGYRFAGFFTDLDSDFEVSGDGDMWYDQEMYCPRDEDSINLDWTPMVIHAKWVAADSDEYIVTLDMQGGTGGTNLVVAKLNQPVPDAKAPTKDGYMFDGYYDSNDKQYYMSSMQSARDWDRQNDTTLIARWTFIEIVTDEYIVTLDMQGGTGGTNLVVAKLNQPMPDAKAPTKDGYVFDGYYDINDKQYYTSSMQSARNWDTENDIVLYAKYNIVDVGYNNQDDGDNNTILIISLSAGGGVLLIGLACFLIIIKKRRSAFGTNSNGNKYRR
ncbi:MAG: InlB B-repeat-containing protein [Firmicutes bacterium]|nr:InlB B-repeat-containing protein [Bacillota bacterium]MCL1954115.1 InlB B-repeat-containing protein [Bacillota bacterium]